MSYPARAAAQAVMVLLNTAAAGGGGGAGAGAAAAAAATKSSVLQPANSNSAEDNRRCNHSSARTSLTNSYAQIMLGCAMSVCGDVSCFEKLVSTLPNVFEAPETPRPQVPAPARLLKIRQHFRAAASQLKKAQETYVA